MKTKFLSPEGRIGTLPGRLAAGPEVLAGRRIAVLDNGKPGAATLLGALAGQIAERAGAREVGVFRKGSAATPCEDDLLGQLTEAADLVLTGTAD